MDSREMFLVMGYGETPMPEVELVFTLDDAFNAVARMVYGDPSAGELLEARADFSDFEERVRDGFEWHAEFEIGGIHAWKVCVPEDLVSALAAQRPICDCDNPEPAAGAALVSNECPVHNLNPRAAPVAVAFDMLAHLQRQRVFSEHTFGPGKRTKMVADHIRKELVEVEAHPSDLTEWVDVILLALDGAWRCGATPAQIVAGIEAKQTKNEGRAWPDWRTADPDKAIEHNRALDETPASVPHAVTAAARDVLAERQRQKDIEGLTPEHDDEHNEGELASAAAAYAAHACGWNDNAVRDLWPPQWHLKLLKTSTPRRDLVKAGALILAEIERIDRTASPPECSPGSTVLSVTASRDRGSK